MIVLFPDFSKLSWRMWPVNFYDVKRYMLGQVYLYPNMLPALKFICLHLILFTLKIAPLLSFRQICLVWSTDKHEPSVNLWELSVSTTFQLEKESPYSDQTEVRLVGCSLQKYKNNRCVALMSYPWEAWVAVAVWYELPRPQSWTTFNCRWRTSLKRNIHHMLMTIAAVPQGASQWEMQCFIAACSLIWTHA